MSSQLKALMARNLYGNDAFYFIINETDETMQKALSEIKKPLISSLKL
jgi:hypothetical protein